MTFYPVPPCPDLDSLPRLSNHDCLLQAVDFAGKDVVDIGCGDGRLARTMADHGQARQVIGIECSARQLAKAQALPPHDRVNIHEGIAQSLPLDDQSVDIAVFFNSLHHVPPAAMLDGLREAARVLRPGGLVYVGEPVAKGAFFAVCQAVDDETTVRQQAQEALCAACAPQDFGGPALFSRQKDLFYLHRVVIPSFEAFQDRIVSANEERQAAFARQEDSLRRLFVEKAEPEDNGAFGFDQPGHMTLLQKPL